MKCKHCGKPIRLTGYGVWMHIKGVDFCSPELITKAEPKERKIKWR